MLILLLASALQQGAERAPDASTLINYPPCALVERVKPTGEAGYDALLQLARGACRTGRPINAAEAEALLGERRFAFRAEPERGLLTVAARPAGETPGRAHGALNAALDAIGAGLYASEFRLAELQAGMLTFYLTPELHSAADGEDGAFRMQYWRGPEAPAMRIIAPEPAGTLAEHELYSQALGETRRLIVYTPPGHDPAAGPYPSVFVADGGKVAYYARQLDPLIVSGRLAPLVMIGLRSGHDGIVDPPEEHSSSDLRNADYTPDFPHGPPRFADHMVFAADEAPSWAAETFNISRDPAMTAVNGRSGGGTFAYQAGLRRPDVFGHALVHSPALGTPDEIPDTRFRAMFHFVSGRYEPGFARRARWAAEELEAAGYETTLLELSAGHTMEITQVTLADRLMAIFPGPGAAP